MKIPRIIHQVFFSHSGVPAYFSVLSQTWKEKNPDWEYRFWNHNSIEQFMASEFQNLIPLFRSFPYDVQRWHFVRYLILYRYGGLYVDMDYECIKPLDSILSDSLCCFGVEPASHAIQYSEPYIIGNALMASIPYHDFLDHIIQEITIGKWQNQVNAVLQIKESTGSSMIKRIYNAYKKKDNITLLPAELVTPLSFEEIREVIAGVVSPEIECKVDNAYAIHYFFNSWDYQIIRKTDFLRPLNLTNKIRIGNPFDGGYVVYQPVLYETDVLITYGVGWDISFEVDFHHRTGKKVWMYDPTMFDEKPDSNIDLEKMIQWKQKLENLQKQNIFFVGEGISIARKPKYDTFENHLKKNQIANEKKLLKIDIEGDEYEIFEDDGIYNNLQTVNQIIIEFHNLKSKLTALNTIVSRLRLEFEVIHVHGNNCGNKFTLYGPFSGITFPDVVEITFVRRKYINHKDIIEESVTFPVAGLDYPNNPRVKDYILSFQ